MTQQPSSASQIPVLLAGSGSLGPVINTYGHGATTISAPICKHHHPSAPTALSGNASKIKKPKKKKNKKKKPKKKATKANQRPPLPPQGPQQLPHHHHHHIVLSGEWEGF
ncbi:hypothetical protein N7528_000698 [Penicillium herquei]|nr:hypothetical protein N7528_000698 [Penicillium herquei]